MTQPNPRSASASSTGSSSLNSASSASTLSTAPSPIHSTVHPVSYLYELAQTSAVKALSFEDAGMQGSKWLVYCHACTQGLQILGRGSGGTKKAAKIEAAAEALKEIEGILGLSRATTIQGPGIKELKRQEAQEKHRDTAAAIFWRSGLPLEASPVVFLALDIECWELGHEYITEVGLAWSVSDTTFGLNDRVRARHMVIAENLDLRNGRFVPDHKDDFNHGKSEIISISDLEGHLHAQIADLQTIGDLLVIGHSISGDIRWLAKQGITVEAMTCDIAEIFKDDNRAQATSLERMARGFGLDCKGLHNAGNDALISLEVFKKLMVTAAMCGREGEMV